MKKIVLLMIAVIMVLATVGCTQIQKPVTAKVAAAPVYPKSRSFDDYDAFRDTLDNNPIEEDFQNAVQDFVCRSASQILKNRTKNTNYSPISLYMALSLAGIGANGDTEQELMSLLGIADKDNEYLSTQMSNMFRVMYTDNEIGKLRIANSLWLNEGTSFKKDYTKKAAEQFYASLFYADLDNPQTAKDMGKWITENTGGVLSPDVKLDNQTILTILNTIYFKDEWIDRFNKDNTKEDTFHVTSDEQVQCDFMNMTYEMRSFVKGDGFTKSALQLKSAGSMTFILPDDGVSVQELLSSPEKVAALFTDDESKYGKVIFQIPRFSFGSQLQLEESLQALGMTKAFEENADFTGITDDMAFISSVKQDSHIAIDERGVEAAAFTQIDYAGAMPPNDDIAEMILNRPFIYYITARDGTVLFIGVCSDPTRE